VMMVIIIKTLNLSFQCKMQTSKTESYDTYNRPA
jgi:hypothetical protein